MSNPIKPTDVGHNRTGIATSPLGFESFHQVSGSTAVPDTTELQETRLMFSQNAEPVGTMPTPLETKGAGRGTTMSEAQSLSVLLDKIGERLAFERTGARLYDALLVKLRASHAHDPSITDRELEEIRDDELRHAGMLATAMEELGGDPTAITPCADVAGVAAGGFAAVLTDAKTTLTQCLGTMLIVELGDLAGWEILIELADQLGYEQLASEFQAAAEEEDRHEKKIRDWVRMSVLGQADAECDPATTTH